MESPEKGAGAVCEKNDLKGKVYVRLFAMRKYEIDKS